jgi:hypothetical protein
MQRQPSDRSATVTAEALGSAGNELNTALVARRYAPVQYCRIKQWLFLAPEARTAFARSFQ